MTSRYEEINIAITDRLIRDIELGAGSWARPWTAAGGQPINAATGKPYSGGNVLLLLLEAFDKGYTTSRWATYRQYEKLGGQVRKGSKGVQLTKWITAAEARRKTDDEDVKRTAFPSVFYVFHESQVDGIEQSTPVERDTVEAIAEAEAFFAAVGARVIPGEPSYSPSEDVIRLPDIDLFRDAVSFASTQAHEHAHYTGHKSRLDRDLTGRFGSESYATEELVAELSAVFTLIKLNITPEPREQSAAYLASWLRVLRSDPKALLHVASLAQRSTDYLAAFSAKEAIAA